MKKFTKLTALLLSLLLTLGVAACAAPAVQETPAPAPTEVPAPNKKSPRPWPDCQKRRPLNK